jgi:adenine-specific DNA-methyltransferase
MLIFGDNIDGLKLLLEQPYIAGNVRLVYTDPPYGTGQTYTISGLRKATISRSNNGRIAYGDRLMGATYLEFLKERLILVRDLMAEDGTIYIHIDLKMGHYVKCLMDDIFGSKNFVNDIARIKCNPKNFSRKGYGNVKDMVLFYTKSKKYLWNNPRQAAQIELDSLRFRSIDSNGRRYTTTPLHAPGETLNGETGKKWREMYPPQGRHWRYPPDVLDKLDSKGLIEWSSTGNPRKKIYADDISRNGFKMQDVWEFKDPQNPSYPTEKNLEMLKMIVKASSNRDDLILDPFCGSGTTLVAAEELGRRWIGIDSSLEAIKVCKNRLRHIEFIDIATHNIREPL